MSISSVSPGSNPYPPGDVQGRFKQVRQEMSDLGSALKAGDLAAAKAALSTLQEQLKANAPAGLRGQVGPGGRNPIGTNLQALDKALQSGDVGSAQAAFSTLQTGMQAAGRAHRHHAQPQGDAALGSGGGTSSLPYAGGSSKSGALDNDGDHDGTTGKSIDITA